GEVLVQHLHRDLAADEGLLAQVDRAHPAVADPPDEAEAAHRGAQERIGRGCRLGRGHRGGGNRKCPTPRGQVQSAGTTLATGCADAPGPEGPAGDPAQPPAPRGTPEEARGSAPAIGAQPPAPRGTPEEARGSAPAIGAQPPAPRGTPEEARGSAPAIGAQPPAPRGTPEEARGSAPAIGAQPPAPRGTPEEARGSAPAIWLSPPRGPCGGGSPPGTPRAHAC